MVGKSLVSFGSPDYRLQRIWWVLHFIILKWNVCLFNCDSHVIVGIDDHCSNPKRKRVAHIPLPVQLEIVGKQWRIYIENFRSLRPIDQN